MAKVYIFSGDDTVNSRKAYLNQIELLKKQNQEIVSIPAKQINGELLENIYGGDNLFGFSRTIDTEGFFSGLKTKEKDQTIEKILTFQKAILISWEEKQPGKTILNNLGNDYILKNFDLPKILWTFLDELSPKNKKQNIQKLHQILQDQDSFFVFSMIIRQFRFLLLAINEETESFPSWQKGKLVHQVKEFGQEKLIEIYKNLLEIDFRQKTSASPFDLGYELDLFILGL